MVAVKKPDARRAAPPGRASRANDPRFAQIMKTIERAVASPLRDEMALEVLGQIFTFESVCGEFELEWSIEAAAELVKAKALNLPDAWLDEMAAVALRQYKWITWWETEGTFEVRCFADQWRAVKSHAKRFRVSFAEAFGAVVGSYVPFAEAA
jgi:hypothetical protein